MDLKTAIETGNCVAVREILAEDASLADGLIQWGSRGECFTHPLHFISDMVFAGTLARDQAPALVEALLGAGADLNYQPDRADGGKGDSPLIGAASLGAEEVGLMLLDAGARPGLRGIFGETALHWAALLGEDRLAARLIEGADLNLQDERYHSPPLGWAIHGWEKPPGGNRGRQREVISMLIQVGAAIDPAWAAAVARAENLA